MNENIKHYLVHGHFWPCQISHDPTLLHYVIKQSFVFIVFIEKIIENIIEYYILKLI